MGSQVSILGPGCLLAKANYVPCYSPRWQRSSSKLSKTGIPLSSSDEVVLTRFLIPAANRLLGRHLDPVPHASRDHDRAHNRRPDCVVRIPTHSLQMLDHPISYDLVHEVERVRNLPQKEQRCNVKKAHLSLRS